MSRRRLRLGFLALSVVSTLILLSLGAGEYYLTSSLHAVQTGYAAPPPATGSPSAGATPAPVVTRPKGRGSLAKKPPTGQPFTMLILGIDSREGTGDEYGGTAPACGCSDTIILARVDPQTDKVSLLSIPRDTYVAIANNGIKAKINSAYGDGVDNSVATIEQSLQIPINHYVVLDLAGFKSIVDAIGGIKMDFPYEVRDDNAGLYVYTTGCQKVNGNTALAISRSRELEYLDPTTSKWTPDPGGEYGRTRRQQIMMKVIAAHTVKESLSNPLTAKSVIDTFTSHNRLELDSQVSATELLDLAGSFAGFNASTMQTFSLPTFTHRMPGPGNPNGIYYEILEPAKDVATIQAWYDATLPTPKKSASPSHSTAPTTPTTVHSTGAVSNPVTATVTTVPPVAVTSGVTSPTSASPSAAVTASPNSPEPWDPVPCS